MLLQLEFKYGAAESHWQNDKYDWYNVVKILKIGQIMALIEL